MILIFIKVEIRKMNLNHTFLTTTKLEETQFRAKHHTEKGNGGLVCQASWNATLVRASHEHSLLRTQLGHPPARESCPLCCLIKGREDRRGCDMRKRGRIIRLKEKNNDKGKSGALAR